MTKIEELLPVAASDPGSAAWGELYQELCPYGECRPEGFALLPELARISAGFAPADRDFVMLLAGQIAVDLDKAARKTYGETLTALHGLTDAWVKSPTGAETFVLRLQTLAALDGDMVWGKRLIRTVNEELELDCPFCETTLLIALDGGGRGRPNRADLWPVTPGELDGVGSRLFEKCVENGQQKIAKRLEYVFGHATCTNCGKTFRVSDQVG